MENRRDLLQSLMETIFSVMKEIGQADIGGSLPVLSHPQVRILFHIYFIKDGITVKDLAESVRVTPGAISQIVDSLVEKGLVTREEDPGDRRMVRLKTTELAASQFNELQKRHLASAVRVFQPLTDEELKQLTLLFSRLKRSEKNSAGIDILKQHP